MIVVSWFLSFVNRIGFSYERRYWFLCLAYYVGLSGLMWRYYYGLDLSLTFGAYACYAALVRILVR